MALGGVKIALCVWLSAICHLVAAERGWSRWYSSDNPGLDGVDNETISRLSLVFDLPCQPSEVEEVECREVGTNESFSDLGQVNGNALVIPCNTTGLVCRDEDQVPQLGRIKCFDYEIRLLCGPLDDERHGDYYDSVGSNGGFIALAAGGSVVLPLVFVLVIQLRKSKREERRRRRQEQQAAEDLARAEAAARAADAPPAYDELFGGNRSVSVISGSSVDSGRGSSAELLMQNETRSHTSSGSSSPNTTSAFPFSSVITSLAIHSAGRAPSNTLGGVTNLVSPQSASGRRESTQSVTSDTASQSSTDALLPASSSNSRVIHQDPPPAYDGSSGGSTSVTFVSPVTANNSSSNSAPGSDAVPRVGQRRFLGMHLSIFDLMAVIYPDPVPTPPPSYDDALKILGVHKQPEIQVT